MSVFFRDHPCQQCTHLNDKTTEQKIGQSILTFAEVHAFSSLPKFMHSSRSVKSEVSGSRKVKIVLFDMAKVLCQSWLLHITLL